MGEYTVDDPEDGYWWHALDGDGLAKFEATDPGFGKCAIQMTATVGFSGVPIIRCRPDREGVTPWLRAGGAVLQVDPAQLDPADYCVLPDTGDIYVKGEAALRAGRLAP